MKATWVLSEVRRGSWRSRACWRVARNPLTPQRAQTPPPIAPGAAEDGALGDAYDDGFAQYDGYADEDFEAP